MGKQSYAKSDRFGNLYQVVGCKPNKRNEEFCTGFIEINKQLYKLEPSVANKEGVSMWVKVTKMKKRAEGGSF